MDPETTLGVSAEESEVVTPDSGTAEQTVTTSTEAVFVTTTTTESVPASTTHLTAPAQKISANTVDFLTRELFRTNHLVDGISDDAFERFQREVEIVHFAPDEVIFEEGAAGDCVYLIARGSVKISKKGRGGQQETLSYLQERDFFGEMALVDDGRRSAQAAAHDECVLGRVNRTGWALLFQIAPTEVLANFTRAITKRLRQNNQHFIEEMMRNERLSMLGTTVSSIVHDMNNPLSCILSASELITTQSSDPLIHRMAGIIRESVRRMESMTHELVEFSRGTTKLNLRATSVSELLRSLEHEFNECRAANIDVRMEAFDNAELEVDSQRMLRVFSNLLRNAREAMQSTGGQLKFRVTCTGDGATFEVSDTGCGIAADVLPTIFEPFVTHGKAHGTGLGLAISKSIVEAHGGKIAVQSAENAGTTFLITLPAAPGKMP